MVLFSPFQKVKVNEMLIEQKQKKQRHLSQSRFRSRSCIGEDLREKKQKEKIDLQTGHETPELPLLAAQSELLQ